MKSLKWSASKSSYHEYMNERKPMKASESWRALLEATKNTAPITTTHEVPTNESHERAIAERNERIDRLTKHVHELQEEVRDLEKALSQQEAAFAIVKQRSNISDELKSAEAEIARLKIHEKEAIARSNKSVADAQSALKDALSKITTLEAQVKAVAAPNTEVADLQTKLADATAKLAAAEATLASSQTEKSTLADRIQQIEKEVDTIKHDRDQALERVKDLETEVERVYDMAQNAIHNAFMAAGGKRFATVFVSNDSVPEELRTLVRMAFDAHGEQL